jgi:hypothetical protein
LFHIVANETLAVEEAMEQNTGGGHGNLKNNNKKKHLFDITV